MDINEKTTPENIKVDTMEMLRAAQNSCSNLETYFQVGFFTETPGNFALVTSFVSCEDAIALEMKDAIEGAIREVLARNQMVLERVQ
jgi:hypothetical protein